MASEPTFVKHDTAWLALLPRLVLLVLLSVLFYQFSKELYLFWALVANIAITFLVKRILMPSYVFKGVLLIEQSKFEAAIKPIQKSIDFYTYNNWIDKYRFLLLISTSKRSIRESCLCNLAYCYLHCGEVAQAKQLYEMVAMYYTKNATAKNMLQTINALLVSRADDDSWPLT